MLWGCRAESSTHRYRILCFPEIFWRMCAFLWINYLLSEYTENCSRTTVSRSELHNVHTYIMKYVYMHAIITTFACTDSHQLWSQLWGRPEMWVETRVLEGSTALPSPSSPSWLHCCHCGWLPSPFSENGLIPRVHVPALCCDTPPLHRCTSLWLCSSCWASAEQAWLSIAHSS